MGQRVRGCARVAQEYECRRSCALPGSSSAGCGASRSQCEGREFESPLLHERPPAPVGSSHFKGHHADALVRQALKPQRSQLEVRLQVQRLPIVGRRAVQPAEPFVGHAPVEHRLVLARQQPVGLVEVRVACSRSFRCSAGPSRHYTRPWRFVDRSPGSGRSRRAPGCPDHAPGRTCPC